jgi:hypothetical protein
MYVDIPLSSILWRRGSNSVVLGSDPAPPQHTTNSASPEVGCHPGMVEYHVLTSEGRQRHTINTKPLKIYIEKKYMDIRMKVNIYMDMDLNIGLNMYMDKCIRIST